MATFFSTENKIRAFIDSLTLSVQRLNLAGGINKGFLFGGSMEIDICGYKVLIDEEDYEKVKVYSWFVDKTNLNQGLIYFCHGTSSEKMRLHRYICGCVKYDKKEVDHKNGNTLDNRKQNLRICTHSQNSKNIKIQKSNKTGYKGVNWHKRDCCYQARISVNMKRIHLGYYNTPEEAYKAYCEASEKYHGEYGRIR